MIDLCYEEWLDEHVMTDDEVVEMIECMEKGEAHEPTEEELRDLFRKDE